MSLEITIQDLMNKLLNGRKLQEVTALFSE